MSRSKSFQRFIDNKTEELDRWKTTPDEYHTKLVGYTLDIDDETETLHIDLIIQPAEPISYITLNFTGVRPNVSFDEVIKKDSK